MNKQTLYAVKQNTIKDLRALKERKQYIENQIKNKALKLIHIETLIKKEVTK